MLRSFLPLFGVLSVAMAAASGLIAAVGRAPEVLVADINHAAHIARDLECVDCHLGVQTHPAAGVPSITICAECHEDAEDAIGGTENGKRILDHVAAKEELWWPQLYSLPDDVVFSHRRHVALGEIACETCHGDIASTTTLPEKPVPATLTMDGCLDCHARSGADQDCFACHK
ncbi:MAG: cytochrome c3 family protein [Planctomycetota bacterium]